MMRTIKIAFLVSILSFLLMPAMTMLCYGKDNYKIAACDWMLLKRQKIGSFKLMSELGGDGVEVDMGGLGKREQFDNKLREAHFQELFRKEAATYNLEVPSIAMSAFYAQSFVTRDNYLNLVQEAVEAATALGAKVIFLPLGVQCDLVKHPELRPILIERLRKAGQLAKKAKVTIGIETALDAAGDVKLLKEINSSAIKIYFKFQNSLENERDLCKELRTLGKKRICMIHCTDTDGVTLPYNTRLDMKKVKETLDSMGWKGWLVVERSRDANDVRNVKKNYGTNITYLKKIFQE